MRYGVYWPSLATVWRKAAGCVWRYRYLFMFKIHNRQDAANAKRALGPELRPGIHWRNGLYLLKTFCDASRRLAQGYVGRAPRVLKVDALEDHSANWFVRRCLPCCLLIKRSTAAASTFAASWKGDHSGDAFVFSTMGTNGVLANLTKIRRKAIPATRDVFTNNGLTQYRRLTLTINNNTTFQ